MPLPLLLAVALVTSHAGRPSPRPVPALVVVVTVDQLRPDYLARFASQYTGGFRAILDHGTLYDHGRQDHAITETAPGHATVLSGREPSGTGIVSNEVGVGDPDAPLLEGDGADGASPRQFRGTTLADWMRAANPATQILSVSRKDRGAILPVGRARGAVFWWHDGRFTTSRYYADTLPTWVRAFDAGHPAERLANRPWTLLLPPGGYTEPDDVPYEAGGRDRVFPHRLPGRGAIATDIADYPWMDSLTLAFALDGESAMGLGRGPKPDLLCVSLSATDAVGHRYGPDSREMHDHLLRLDRWLGGFLDTLAARTPGGRLLVVLTADHGVQSFPERSGTGRVWWGDLATGGRVFWSGLLTADTAALRGRGLAVDSVARSLAARAARRGVARVFTPASLTAAGPNDTAASLWRHAIPNGYGWLLAGVLKEGFVWSPADAPSAEHGSTATADVEVPIAFLGPGIRRGVVHRPVRTVDIAPTLATWLGLEPAERLDGSPLAEISAGP